MIKEDLDILYWFIKIAHRTDLKHIDILTFETSLQFPIPPKRLENEKINKTADR